MEHESNKVTETTFYLYTEPQISLILAKLTQLGNSAVHLSLVINGLSFHHQLHLLRQGTQTLWDLWWTKRRDRFLFEYLCPCHSSFILLVPHIYSSVIQGMNNGPV